MGWHQPMDLLGTKGTEQYIFNNGFNSIKKKSRGLRLWGMGVVLVLKIWNEISRLILWVWVKMVKNRIELFRRLFALGREVLIFVVRYKQKWPPPPRENFIVFHKWFVLKSTKNQSITNILTASVVLRMLIDSLLSNQWWIFPVKKFRE